MTEAEKKASELAEQYSITKADTILDELAIEQHFKAGFLAALELAEVKGLEEAVKHYSNTEEDALWWEGVNKPGVEQNYGKYADAALTAWRSFRGEK